MLFPPAIFGKQGDPKPHKPASEFVYPKSHENLTGYDKGAAMPEAIESYTQEFTVTFRTEDAARRAIFEPAPLYNDYAWSTACRWDDNNPNDKKMRDVLEKHGYHATWYLYNPEISYGNRGSFAATGTSLLAGGNSLGSHSWSHHFVSYLNCNRIFEEMSRGRAVWEAVADTQITCFAFPMCNYRNDVLGDQRQIEVHQALRRAGLYLSAERPYNDMFTDAIGMILLPHDGYDIDEYVEKAIHDPPVQREYPMLCHCYHAWYGTPEGWRKFEGQLDKYGHNPDWWYCTHNQYAAYRYQFLHTSLAEPVRNGKAVRVAMHRPGLLDLNDPTPLTFRVKDVAHEDVVSVASPTADCVASDRKTDCYLFSIAHDRAASLPKKTGYIANGHNRSMLADGDEDGDFPGLKALLFHDGQGLRLILKNETSVSLSHVRVTYRLPLAWQEGVVRRVVKAEVQPGTQWEDSLKPSALSADYKYTAGIAYYQAQVDFVLGTEVGRLHLDLHVKNTVPRDASYPQGGFARLGLIPDAEMNVAELIAEIQRGRFLTEPWPLRNGKPLQWTSQGDTPCDAPFLDTEMIRTLGQDKCEQLGYYILQSALHSGDEQPVEFRCTKNVVKRIFLNGDEVTGVATLRRGENRLVLIYHTPGTVGAEVQGCLLRLVKPGTSQRISDVQFEPTE
jgi:peptidoglycan/xylan/chitin deacetylase (PgdA/CDA1 family)